MIGLILPIVSLGQAFFSVIIALSSALWLGQAGLPGIFEIAFSMMLLADVAFFRRQATTFSTETGSSSFFQQS